MSTVLNADNLRFTFRKRKREISYMDSHTSDSSSEDENGVMANHKEIKQRLHQPFSETFNHDVSVPTEYELKRLRNIEERKRLLCELKIDEVKEELKVIAKPKARIQRVKPRLSVIRKQEKNIEPRQKSLRLQRKGPSGEPLPEKKIETPKSAIDSAVQRKPSGPLPMKSTLDDCHAETLNSFVKLYEEDTKDDVQEKNLHCDIKELRKRLCNMTLSSERIARIVPYRIYSMAVHPAKSKLLLAVGDKWGNLGFWDVLAENGVEGVQLFQPHSGPVNCSNFSIYDPAKIFSTSHDGTVRCGDMNQLIFDEVYASDENISRNHTTWHCEVEANTLMVTHGNGDIALIDTRSTNSPEAWYTCHERSCRTVQLHPIHQYYFITSSTMCEVKIWDRRYIKKTVPQAVHNLVHPKGLTSAFFSPSGKYVVTTCNDDRLRIYDSTHINTVRPSVAATIKHNTHTGQWLTTFKATWHPQHDVLVVGSMEYPRRVQLYDYNGEKFHELKDENLASVCSVNTFHPTEDIIFGGNSSGRVHVFM